MRKIIYNLLAVTLVMCLTSCETTELSGDNSEDLIDAATLSEQIKDVVIEPVTEDLEGDYKISLRFKESIESSRMPDVFKLCNYPEVEPLRSTLGEANVFSSITDNEKIREMYLDSMTDEANGGKAKGFKFVCEVSITSPGQYDRNCKKTCSDESIFGGSTWFCVCVHSCEIGYE